MSRTIVLLLALAALQALAQTHTPVVTYHNDNARTGSNNNETVLTWSNVNTSTFGKLSSRRVDGYVYAQPLYFPQLTIGGKTHNVVFAATENNSVYAFDADTKTFLNDGVLWRTNFNHGPPGVKVTPVPVGDISCNHVAPVIGITGTPVIDADTLTLYVVAMTKEVAAGAISYVHRLHALDLTTGQEKFGGPVQIQGSVRGTCGITDGHGNVVFTSLIHLQRPALLLAGGIVYVAFGSDCDNGQYNGWLIGYNAATLKQTAILNTSPDVAGGQCGGALWQSGAGPAADQDGNVFLVTANGGFNANVNGRSFGDSFLRLSTTQALSVSDYFTPMEQAFLSAHDWDLGSSGPLVLPDQPGAAPHLLVGAGKEGVLYLLNRDNMGKFNALQDQVYQEIPNALGHPSQLPFPMPVYVNQAIYFGAATDSVKGFLLSNGRLNATPFAESIHKNGYFGAGVSSSSDPAGNNAIIWAMDSQLPAVLHAYRANDLTELYNSTQARGRDAFFVGIRFSVPTIADGKVFVGTPSSVDVFGILP